MKKLSLFFCVIVLITLLGISYNLHAATYNFTTIVYPAGEGTLTLAGGINDVGQIVGTYNSPGPGDINGYIYDKTGFTSFGYPGAWCTYGYDINNSGNVVGLGYSTVGESQETNGYMYNGDTFSDFNTPSHGINNLNQILLNHVDNQGSPRNSFTIYDGTTYTNFLFPEIFDLNCFGINDAGHVVGSYNEEVGSPGNPVHWEGFLYEGNTFSTINFPNALHTRVTGINNNGDIVGNYTMDGYTFNHGFLYDGNSFVTIDYPQASLTYIEDINDSGEIVGYYDYQDLRSGFLAGPVPIPSAIWLLGSAFIGLVGVRKYRKDRFIHI